ncbi:MAG: beta-galactosidase [Promethearchaeota archaeon]
MEQNSIGTEVSSVSLQPSLKLEGYTIRVEGEVFPLYSGSVDYWRIPSEKWDQILERIVGIGFRIISLAIPWNIHEIASGLFDFGTTNKQRNLEGFLTLCRNRGLYVIVRPGPCVNEELNYFGYPKRILYDAEIQAQTAYGTRVIIPAVPNPFPMPSYASEKFYDEVSKFFDVVCPIITRHLAPGGPIISVQIDNDISRIFLNGAFSADYSAHAIRWYHEFLTSKYPSIGGLNRAYRTRYNEFTDIEPPRALAATEREALPRFLDWMEFQEYYVALSLSVLASLLWSRGVRGIPTSHSIRSSYPSLPLNVYRTERELDFQGVGLYLSQSHYDDIRRSALYLSTVSRFPYLSESGMGIWPWGPGLQANDQQFALLVAMMYGFRGFNTHMLVGRNRWLGSPISQQGIIDDTQFTFLKRILEILQSQEFHSLQRNVPVVLLRNLEYERLYRMCTNSNWLSHLLGLPDELLLSNRTFSYTETIQKAYPALWNAFYWGLTRSKIPFVIGDTEMDPPALNSYQALIIPSFDFMSEALQSKIGDFVERGGTAIVGPEIPYLGTDMRGCTILADRAGIQPTSTRRPLVGLHDPFSLSDNKVRVGNRVAGGISDLGKGKIMYLGITLPPTLDREDAIEAETALTKSLKHLNISAVGDARNSSVDEVYWGTRAPRIIFQVNATNQPQSVSLMVAKRAVIRDLWTGEQLTQKGPQEIALNAHDFRIFEVVR